MENKTKAFARLLTIMDELREQCPWDKKQTMDSLRYLTIEELYELSDAILEKDMVDIKKELGDLLLHIVFYARIGSETNDFDIADVINSVCDKLVHRHPHIYGDVKVANEEEVKANWEKKSQVWDKVLEEIEELKVEIEKGDNDRIESEFGDVLFALTNYARFINVNPEDALERTNKRFIKRFQIMENKIKEEGKDMSEMSLIEMDIYWEKAKKIYLST